MRPAAYSNPNRTIHGCTSPLNRCNANEMSKCFGGGRCENSANPHGGASFTTPAMLGCSCWDPPRDPACRPLVGVFTREELCDRGTLVLGCCCCCCCLGGGGLAWVDVGAVPAAAAACRAAFSARCFSWSSRRCARVNVACPCLFVLFAVGMVIVVSLVSCLLPCTPTPVPLGSAGCEEDDAGGVGTCAAEIGGGARGGVAARLPAAGMLLAMDGATECAPACWGDTGSASSCGGGV